MRAQKNIPEQLKLSDFEDKSLLILDDDDPLRSRLARAMDKKGFQVKEAKTVAEGLNIVKSTPPSFACEDLRLEDGNGLDVVKELSKINKEFLNHDTLTDVITFDYSTLNEISGEIFISIDRVRENASEFQQSFEVEIRRVMIHGLLHLCGYNDKTTKEKSLMSERENFYLDSFS